MANNYLEFSEVIENLTPEEISWWENEAQHVGNEDYDTICQDFELEKDEHKVWFHTDECGDVEAVALLVQAFLGKFRINDYFTLTWACWCSKPRIGEFGGGAMFVTAHETKFHNTYDWVLELAGEWADNHGG